MFEVETKYKVPLTQKLTGLKFKMASLSVKRSVDFKNNLLKSRSIKMKRLMLAQSDALLETIQYLNYFLSPIQLELFSFLTSTYFLLLIILYICYLRAYKLK